MGKVCPTCARQCTDASVFCPGCGTNIQNVMPVMSNRLQNDPPIMGAAKTAEMPLGKKILYFVPLALMIFDIIAIWLFNWVSVSIFGNTESFSLVDICELVPSDKALALMIMGFPLFIDWILILIGSILLAFKKTAGKVLSIVGNSLILPSIAWFALVILAEFDIEPAVAKLSIAPIILFVSAIVGIVFASVVKTGKDLMRKSYLAYIPVAVYTPVNGQPVYPQQQYYN